MRLKKNLIVVLNAKVGHIFLKFYHSLNHRFHLRLLTFNTSGFVWKIEFVANLNGLFESLRVTDSDWKAEMANQIIKK